MNEYYMGHNKKFLLEKKVENPNFSFQVAPDGSSMMPNVKQVEFAPV
jgi:hypothetical protein